MSVCVYCSRKTKGAPTCVGHRDLVAIDPFYSPDVPQKAEPAEDVFPDVLPDRLMTQGR